MDTIKLVSGYLEQQHVMQLATSVSNQPWSCSVYYVADEERNLYWASLPDRRHSLEIKRNPKVAVSMVIKDDLSGKVIGIQAEGTAEQSTISESNRPIAEKYATKFNRRSGWVNDFVAGKTKHALYKFIPTNYVLFDDFESPTKPRLEA